MNAATADHEGAHWPWTTTIDHGLASAARSGNEIRGNATRSRTQGNPYAFERVVAKPSVQATPWDAAAPGQVAEPCWLGALRLMHTYFLGQRVPHADAEDLTQRVALRLIMRSASGEIGRSSLGFLFARARTMAIDWWRARRGTRAITGKDLTTIEEAGGWVRGSRGLPAAPSEESLRTVIMESWPRLSSVEVDLVFMRYVHGETVVAAAARRNWSVGQTRKRIAVSQEKLKTEWGSNAN